VRTIHEDTISYIPTKKKTQSCGEGQKYNRRPSYKSTKEQLLSLAQTTTYDKAAYLYTA